MDEILRGWERQLSEKKQVSDTDVSYNHLVDNIQTNDTQISHNTNVENIQNSDAQISYYTKVDNAQENDTKISHNTNEENTKETTYEKNETNSHDICIYSTCHFDKIKINNKYIQLSRHLQKSKKYQKLVKEILDDYCNVSKGKRKTNNYDIFNHYEVVIRYKVLLTIIKHYPEDITNKLKKVEDNKIVVEIYGFIKENYQNDDIFDNSIIVLDYLITMTLEAEKILDSIDYYDKNEFNNMMSEVKKILDSIN